MAQAKKLLAQWHVDKDTHCRYRFIESETERQILHYHDFFEIFLTLDDNLIHIVNGMKKPLPKGALVFVRPSDTHLFSSDTPFTFINLAIDAETLSSIRTFLTDAFPFERLLAQDFPPSVLLSEDDLEKLCSRITHLATIPMEDADKKLVHTRLLLADILTEFFENYEKQDNKSIPFWLSNAYEKMKQKENFSEGIPAFLRLTDKTHEHTERSFKKFYGISLGDAVNRLRINYAVNMIINSNRSLSDIAYDAGFQNISWFHTYFKRCYGISPGEFRKKYKQ